MKKEKGNRKITTVWIFQETTYQDVTLQDIDIVKEKEIWRDESNQFESQHKTLP